MYRTAPQPSHATRRDNPYASPTGSRDLGVTPYWRGLLGACSCRIRCRGLSTRVVPRLRGAVRGSAGGDVQEPWGRFGPAGLVDAGVAAGGPGGLDETSGGADRFDRGELVQVTSQVAPGVAAGVRAGTSCDVGQGGWVTIVRRTCHIGWRALTTVRPSFRSDQSNRATPHGTVIAVPAIRFEATSANWRPASPDLPRQPTVRHATSGGSAISAACFAASSSCATNHCSWSK